MRNTIIKLLLAWSMLMLSAGVTADDFADGMAALTGGDYTTAYRAFKRLAKRDHVEAQFQLGMLYLHGRGTKQNTQQGVNWLKQAAEDGYYYLAANELGQIYLAGQWVERSETEAIKWLELATQIAEENEDEADDGCD
ncbi:MAG: sel1 repeat family protein [Candidatus Thiodiazotropha taylori]|nr:sel1 repeat family protein [Candidatus Thiodiazotropha taylori]